MNPNILVEAKNSYTRRLSDILTPLVYKSVEAIYEDSRNLRDFQDKLKDIPRWNQDRIDMETEKVTQSCPWVYDLVSAVFITNTKVLTVVKLNNQRRKIDITIPKLNRFIHRVFTETAREFFKNPMLLEREGRTSVELQSIMRESLALIDGSIENAIRNLLPFQEILQNYLSDVPQEPTPTPEVEEAIAEALSRHSSRRGSSSSSHSHSTSGPANLSEKHSSSSSSSEDPEEVKVLEFTGGRSSRASQSEPVIKKIESFDDSDEGNPDGLHRESAPWSDAEETELPEIFAEVEPPLGAPREPSSEADTESHPGDVNFEELFETAEEPTGPSEAPQEPPGPSQESAGPSQEPVGPSQEPVETLEEPVGPSQEPVETLEEPEEEPEEDPREQEDIRGESQASIPTIMSDEEERDLMRLSNKRRIPKIRRKKKEKKQKRRMNFFDVASGGSSSSAF